jgi:phage-related protein
LFTAIQSGSDTIVGAAQDTNDWKESLSILKNRVLTALEPVATKVFGAIGTAIEAVTPFIETAVEWLSVNLPRAFETVRAVVGPVVETISGFFSNLAGSLDSSGVEGVIGRVSGAFQTVATTVGQAFEVIKGIVGPVFETIVEAFQNNADKISGFATRISNIFGGLGDIIKAIFDGIKAFWAQWGDEIMAVIGNVVDTIIAIVGGVIRVFEGIIDFIAGIFTGDWKRVWEGVKNIFGGIWDAITGVIGNAFENVMVFFGDWIADVRETVGRGVNNIVTFFKELPGRILNWLKELPGKMLQFGKDLVQSILNGLGDLASSLFNKLKEGISNAIDAVKSFFGFGSPSRWMAKEVGLPLAQGVFAGWEKGLGDADFLGATNQALSGVRGATANLQVQAAPGMDTDLFGGASTNVVVAIDPEGKERLAEFVVDWQNRRVRQVVRAGGK